MAFVLSSGCCNITCNPRLWGSYNQAVSAAGPARPNVRMFSRAAWTCSAVPSMPQPKPQRTLNPALLSFNRFVIHTAVSIVDHLYADKDQFRRFYVLEVLARIPFFAYACMLHLQQTLGLLETKQAARLRAHLDEADNEAVHLEIMMAMGAGTVWFDQFLARHLAVVYFFVSIGLFVLNPAIAYNLSELIEHHAYDTYDDYIRKYGCELQNELAVPLVAHDYYSSKSAHGPRQIENMMDVFLAVRDDERYHANALSEYGRS